MKDLFRERWIEGFGVRWEYTPALQLNEIDKRASLTNMGRIGLPIDEAWLEMLIIALEQGDEFEAIVVYKSTRGQYVIIDGNHRYIAAERVGLEALDAYIVDVQGDAALVAAMTSSANPAGGSKPVMLEARVELGMNLVNRFGFEATDAARMVRVREKQLQRAIRADRTEKKLRVLGLDTTPLKRSHLIYLHTLRDEDVMLETARLVADAKLTVDKTDAFVREIREEPTKEQKLAKINGERAKPQIGVRFSRRGVRTARPNKRLKLFDLLGKSVDFLDKNKDPASLGMANVGDLQRISELQLRLMALLDAFVERVRESIP